MGLLRRYLPVLLFLSDISLLAEDPPEVEASFEAQIEGKKFLVRASGEKVEIGGRSYAISLRELETKTFNDGITRLSFHRIWHRRGTKTTPMQQ